MGKGTEGGKHVAHSFLGTERCRITWERDGGGGTFEPICLPLGRRAGCER